MRSSTLRVAKNGGAGTVSAHNCASRGLAAPHSFHSFVLPLAFEMDCEDKCMKRACWSLTLPAVVTVIVLIAVSFSSLEPNEVGLRYNKVAQRIDSEELYTAGRHFLGPGHTLISYTTAVQTVQYTAAENGAIVARTQDGLAVSLGFSFNYRILDTINHVYDLYHTYGEMTEVAVFYNRLARNSVREVASEFTAFSLITNRTQAQIRMHEHLSTAIGAAHGSVESVQLLEVSLPTRFEQARVRLETASQEAEQARAERANSEQQAANDIQAARVAATSILNQASADAQSTVLQARAAADSLKARLAANREAYGEIKEQLGLSEDELLAYIFLEAVREAATGSATNRAPRDVILNLGANPSLDLTPMQAAN